MVVAVDFDKTISVAEYPGIDIDKKAVDILRRAQTNGHAIVLWTCRHGKKLDAAIKACKDHNLYFDAINDNEPVQALRWRNLTGEKETARKIFADIYIDDRAVPPGEKIPWEKYDAFLNK